MFAKTNVRASLLAALLALTFTAPVAQAQFLVTNAPGFSITWDGNNGDNENWEFDDLGYMKFRYASINDRPIAVRACGSLEQAYMYSTAPIMFPGALEERHQALTQRVKLFRWGGDCYAYGLLAAGHVDLVVENSLKLYDFAALVPVIKGAGGLITDWRGKDLDMHSDGSVIAAGDPAILTAARKILAG